MSTIQNLAVRYYKGKVLLAGPEPGAVKVYYRPETTDENCLDEVLQKKPYYRPKMGFEVLPGEHWLDLGANIGAFAVYCRLRGATCDCYEPVQSCFDILKKNVGPGSTCTQAAVTNIDSDFVELWESSLPGNYYRGTIIKRGKVKPKAVSVPNYHALELEEYYDGIKMDIEGAEFGILDDDLLPACEKLCFEYHLSRDPSAKNLVRRRKALSSRFGTVKWGGGEAEYALLTDPKGPERPWQDRVFFCVV